jgi:hypothetical protein
LWFAERSDGYVVAAPFNGSVLFNSVDRRPRENVNEPKITLSRSKSARFAKIKGYGPAQDGFHASDLAKEADTAHAGGQTTQPLPATVLAERDCIIGLRKPGPKWVEIAGDRWALKEG